MGMRTTKRARREVPPSTIWALGVAFRYSPARDAYILRGIGERRGPVLRPKK
jgi:hypothetical protein